MEAITKAYIDILVAHENEIQNHNQVGVLLKDITGDGIPELAYIQADYRIGFDFEPGELTPYCEEQPNPQSWYLIIWTFDTEPKLLLKKRLEDHANRKHYQVFADADGRIHFYITMDSSQNSSYTNETYEIYAMKDGEYVREFSQEYSTIREMLYDQFWRFQIDDAEVSETDYKEALSNAYEKRGELLLFASRWRMDAHPWDDQNDETPPLSVGLNETIAMIQYMTLDEKERMNHIAHGAYVDFMAPGVHLKTLGYGHRSINLKAEYYYLFDMNNDGTDELLLAVQESESTYWYWKLYTYQNGSVKLIDDNSNSISIKTDVCIVGNSYIGVITVQPDVSDAGGYYEYTGYDGEIVYKYTMEPWREVRQSGELVRTFARYFLNDEEIREDEYNRFVSSMSGDSVPLSDALLPILDS